MTTQIKRLLSLSAIAFLILAPLASQAGQRGSGKPQIGVKYMQDGSARISLLRQSSGFARPLSLAVPGSVARQFVKAADSRLTVFASKMNRPGSAWHMVAGKGKNTVTIQRIKHGWIPGGSTTRNVKVQIGQGKDALAFFTGRVARWSVERLGGGLVKNANRHAGSSGVLAVVNPKSLKLGRTSSIGYGSWWIKPLKGGIADPMRALPKGGRVTGIQTRGSATLKVEGSIRSSNTLKALSSTLDSISQYKSSRR